MVHDHATRTDSTGKRSARRRAALAVMVSSTMGLVVVGMLVSPRDSSRSYSDAKAAASTAAPIRAAFYYPWFPETERWATRYSPSLGRYSSDDPALLATHVTQAR